MAKASVIIPAYNAEKVLPDCLKALKSQSTRPLEVIIVDDGSKDSTSDVAKKFGAKVLRQKNKGPASARNLGASKASGDILLFTDADCVPDKDWMKEMMAPFRGKAMAGVQGAYRTKQKQLLAKFSQAEIEDRYRRMGKKGTIDFIGTYSAGYRKDIFRKFGGFDESFPKASGEDPELSFRMAEKGHRLVFNRKAIVYHIHPDSLIKYLKQKYERAYWRVLLYKKHPGKAVKESYTPQTLKLQIGLIYLMFPSAVASVFVGIFPFAALLIILIATTIPSSARFSSKGAGVAISSPLILILRSLVFSLGLAAGTIKAKSG